MTKLAWDNVGERFYETGVDQGVLYIPSNLGVYNNGVAWNGLTAVTETPSGATSTAQYADNIKYLNLVSAETLDGTIEAFTYPDEFAQYDGLDVPTPGVMVGQQSRKGFGLCYRTRVGNDVDGDSLGYKLHLMYGVSASPSEKVYGTINDTPAPIAFKWTITTTPVSVTGKKPTSLITIDSTKVLAADLTALELILYGSAGIDPALPLPDDVISMFSTGVTTVATLTPATYVTGTHTITIPTQTGIVYSIAGVTQAAGPIVLTEGQSVIVTASAIPGYVIGAGNDNDWEFTY